MNIKYSEPQINYYVDDVERAVRFYTANFGFVETFRTPQQGAPDHVEVRLGGLVLGLASREAGKNVHGLPLGPADNPRVELVLWTENVDEAFAQLAAKGIPVIKEPHDFLGMLRAAWFMDPEGNPVEIVARLGTNHNS